MIEGVEGGGAKDDEQMTDKSPFDKSLCHPPLIFFQAMPFDGQGLRDGFDQVIVLP